MKQSRRAADRRLRFRERRAGVVHSGRVDPCVMAAAAFLASVLLLLPFGSLSRDVGAEPVQESGSSLVRDEIRHLRDSLVLQIEAAQRGFRHSRPQPRGRERC